LGADPPWESGYNHAMATPYEVAWSAAKAEPERFWAEAATAIDWFRPWDRVLDDRRRPFTRWFPGGLTNRCHNALDRHVATRGDQVALIYDSPVTQTIRRFTYATTSTPRPGRARRTCTGAAAPRGRSR
jgi:hypothetical protein